jgi:hypothetical protein
MPRHIYERYAPGDRVEVRFGDAREWRAAVVVRADPPGLWVMTADGREWFVTNTYRIRAAEEKSSADLAD